MRLAALGIQCQHKSILIFKIAVLVYKTYFFERNIAVLFLDAFKALAERPLQERPVAFIIFFL